ncbi:molybdopterin-dependent oxidoreductase [candidate division KSB1 bacterium]|nr:molybdopterin-dependent oxidoreductase [candidate division KSB1 bacterium]
MNSLTRRKFLKIGATSVGVAAAGRYLYDLPGVAQAIERGAGDEDVQTIPTYCDICFWKCGVIAHVAGGKLWKLEGNPADPLSNGRLCPRGTGGVGAHYDPDRLRAPLLRKSVRGQEEWIEVTWGEALDFIAGKMQSIKSQYGPEAMALFSHGIGGNFLKHTLKAYGSPNIAAPSFAQCRGPRDVGFRLTFGEDVSSPERTDIRNAKCIVLIGSHLGENMHNTQVQEFAEAIEQGATVIVADPRYSVAASKAKYYLPVKPGTDLALLLAWMNVIVTEQLYDAEYIAAHGFGFEQFAAEILHNTPEWAYPLTGVEPALIRESARDMARFRPATLIHPGRHVNWYGDDAQRSRAIALLNALLGSWGRKGGFYYPANMDLPGYPYPPYPKSDKGKVDNPDHKYPFAHETITTGIREATLTGTPYPIKGWMVYATNLLQALPNEAETIRAIQKLDLLVVVDVIPSEIAGWADVVLPESVYLERFDDLNVEWFRDPFISIRQPVVKSPDDQQPNWWIARELALRLGLADYYPWQDIEEYFRFRLAAGGYNYEELKEQGILRGDRQPIYFDEGVPAEFGTPSGKIEFYSLQLAEHGFDPVPRFTPPPEPPPGYFRLLFGRAPVHSFSRTHTNRVLMDMMNENEVWVNADVAARLGLKSGDRVKLKNEDGVISNSIKVKATERIRTDCVYLVHGFGHTAKGMRHARGRGASDSQLITRYVVDPLMGGTGMNVNFVTIESEG